MITFIFEIMLTNRASTDSTKKVEAGSFMWPKFEVFLILSGLKQMASVFTRQGGHWHDTLLYINTVQSPVTPLKILPIKGTKRRCLSTMEQTLFVHWNLFSLLFFQFLCIIHGPLFCFGWLSIWKDRHLTKQLQASVMKAGTVSETCVFALFYSVQHLVLHTATRLPFFSSPRPRWLSWGIISDDICASVGHFHLENFIKQSTVHDFSCQWITLVFQVHCVNSNVIKSHPFKKNSPCHGQMSTHNSLQ